MAELSGYMLHTKSNVMIKMNYPKLPLTKLELETFTFLLHVAAFRFPDHVEQKNAHYSGFLLL